MRSANVGNDDLPLADDESLAGPHHLGGGDLHHPFLVGHVSVASLS